MCISLKMIIRKLTANDQDAFLELINDFRPTHFTENQFCKMLEVISHTSDIYVIEHENKLIATATLIFEHKFIFNLCTLAHVEDVCVKKEIRGSGLGMKIVQHCVEVAKDRGAYKITLDCASSNIPFYEKCGFETRGTQMTILLKEPTA